MSLLLLAALASAAASPAPQIGDPAPPFELPTLAGGRIAREQLRGQITVVEFFASWCVPCVRGLADLRALWKDLGPGVKLLIIAIEDDLPALRRYFAERPLPEGTVVAVDAGDQVGRRWGRDRLPTTFFLDRDAIIRHINRGHGPGFRARATRWLRRMLASAAATQP